MIRKFEFVAKLNSFLHQFVKCKHRISRSKNSNISWSTFDIIVYTKKGHGTGSNANSLMFFETSCIKIYYQEKIVYIHIDSQPAGSLQTEEDTWPPSFIFIVSRMVHMGHRKQWVSLYYKPFKVLQLENIPRYLKRNILQKFVLLCYILKGQFQNTHLVWLRSWPRD